MSRIRFILLSVMAVVVMSAIASATASAHRYVECLKAEAGKGTYEESKCEKAKTGGEWEKLEIANVKFTGTGGISKLKSSLLKAEILITCNKAVYAGELETAGAGKGEVTLEECSIGNGKEAFLNCEVPNINFKLRGILVESAKSEIEEEFKPASGTTFVELVIKNKGEKSCAEKGTFPVQGTQICEFSSGKIFNVTHEIACKPAGSHLAFDGEVATFESDRSIGTASNDAWAVE